MFTLIKEDVTVSFSSLTVTGDISHDPSLHAMILDDPSESTEIITTNLSAYGLEPQADTVFIKDWSEHDGLTDSLVAAGVIEIVRKVFVGPFNSPAYEVRPLGSASMTAEMKIKEAA